MPARSKRTVALLSLAIAACQPAAPGLGSPPEPTTAAAASAAPTRPPTVTPSPRPGPGVVVNPDGSVRVRFATDIGFAEAVGVDDTLWGVVQDTERHVVRIDPETYEVETVIDGIPILPTPHLPIAAEGSIWLVSPGDIVTQYDAATGEQIRDIHVGHLPVEPVVAFGDVWTLNHDGGSVTRIDTQTGNAGSIDLPGSRPLTMTVVADDLIVVNGPGPIFHAADPKQMKQIGAPYQPGTCFTFRGVLGYGIDGAAWLKPCEKDQIVIVDPRTGTVLETFESPAFPYPPLVVDGIPWFPNAESNTRGPFRLFGLDPVTHEVVATYEQPTDITEGWVFAAFDSWWRWGNGGLLRVPADTLRAAAG